MTLAAIIVLGLIVIFSVTVIWALGWAARNGQMGHFREGAESIFDGDEPIGRMTDHFPQGNAGKTKDEKPSRP